MAMSQMLEALKRNDQYKYPYVFLALYITFLLATVCLANRITLFGPYLEPGGMYVFVFTFCICDIVGEVYGYAYPRLFIWIGLAAEFIFAAVVTGVAHFPAPNYFLHAEAYRQVFDPTLRYVFSAFVALLVGEFANVYLLAKWKVRFKGKLFIVRSILATAIGQALLTVVVDLLNYTGSMSLNHIASMMISGYLWKIAFALIMAFPAWLLVRWLKVAENIDYMDINTNFNPFIFSLKERETPVYSNDPAVLVKRT